MKDDLYAMRHSLAHIMAAAVKQLWPNAKFGVGPVIDNGFYYDIDIDGAKVSESDFGRIENQMRQIIEADYKFEQFEMGLGEAIEWAKQNSQPYKEELLNDLSRSGTTVLKNLDSKELGLAVQEGESLVEKASFYKCGDFVDLCRGPHVGSTSQVGAFKLTKISGVYWRGDENKPQMQRLYGLAFANQSELDDHLELLEQARQRDHRKLGQELDLFVFSDLVGSGLPLFTPRGTAIREELIKFSEELQKSKGYQKVFIPHITKNELYKTSGHWDKFGDELFLVKSQETDDEFVLKPMNCPHHIQIFAANPKSYKDLPVRYMETTVQYRDEKKGELNGLSRVRAISIDDAHVFCTIDQIESEFTAIMSMIKDMYSAFDMKFRARLSFRDDSPGYLGESETWDRAQSIIESVAKNMEIDYFIAKGEAAFYGPKIDIMVTDALGREWQCATQQLDFVQPERFGLKYADSDGSERPPVMIHKALLGSVERFLSVYIEHTAGRFPVWLAPEQVRIITVNQEQATVDFARLVEQKAQELNIRVGVDNDNQSVGKKIRQAEIMKIPYTVVIGANEIESSKLQPRVRADLSVHDQHEQYNIDAFFGTIANEIKARASRTSL